VFISSGGLDFEQEVYHALVFFEALLGSFGKGVLDEGQSMPATRAARHRRPGILGHGIFAVHLRQCTRVNHSKTMPHKKFSVMS
jgi:hypothetical protein